MHTQFEKRIQCPWITLFHACLLHGCTPTSLTDEDDGLFPLPTSTARVESRPAYRSTEPESVRTGWSPDSRTRLDDVSRRSSSRGGTFRTTSRRRGSTTVLNSDGSRRHLGALEVAGLTREMVARLAKVSVEDLATISSPDEVSIDASVAQRVLAVTFHPSDDRQWTPGVGAQRRIRALVAMGFPFDDLAQRVGVSSDVLESLPARGFDPRCLVDVHRPSLRRAFDDAGRSRPCRPRLGPRRSKLVASVGVGRR